jgi:hypothetical protein
MEKKKAVLKITLTVGLDLNKEHSYQAVTRLEGEIHNHVAMGMLAGYHPDDASVTDVDVTTVIEDL